MNEIEINGKTYVLKTDVEKWMDSKKSDIKGLEESKVYILDDAYTMGMGSVKVGSDFKVVNVSIDLLEKALKSVKLLHYGKGKRESITLGLCNELPLLIGDCCRKEGSREFSGILIAPRIDD